MLIFLFAALPSCLAFGFAGYLAMHGLTGWGWFLFVGVCALPKVKMRGNNETQ